MFGSNTQCGPEINLHSAAHMKEMTFESDLISAQMKEVTFGFFLRKHFENHTIFAGG